MGEVRAHTGDAAMFLGENLFLCCQLFDPGDSCGLEQSEIAQADPTEFTEGTRVNQIQHTR